MSVCLPRIESSERIVIKINKKQCEVSLLNNNKLIAKLTSDAKDCKIYLINDS